jgi:hypothetical protein
MKQKLLTRLILGALAGMAAGGAIAGQIQASSVSIAREVIITNAQEVIMPQVAYRFAGDVDARTQVQTFQVQLILPGGGGWGTVGNVQSISVTDGVTGVEVAQVAPAVTPNSAAAPQYRVLAINRSGNTLFATIEVGQGANGLIKQPIIGFNSAPNAGAGRAAPTFTFVNNLFSVVGAITECDLSNRTLGVDIRHYKALTNPTALATDANASADEHTRAGSTNAGTVIVFPTNIEVRIAAALGRATVNPAGGNVNFQGPATAGIVAPNADSFISPTLINLGFFRYLQNASGYDSDVEQIYSLSDPDVAAGIVRRAPGGAIEPTAAVDPTTSGNVEVNRTRVDVTASQGFATGAGNSVFLSATANCAAALNGTAGTFSADGKTATVFLNTQAEISAAHGPNGNNPVYICYQVNGATFIPQSAFTGTVRLEKATDGLAAAALARFQEQDNFCTRPLYALGGGVKIDVRNYVNSKSTAGTGYMSIIRLINNSENLTADISAQIIHADGSYGPWGSLNGVGGIPGAGLAPRAVANLTAAQIDGALTNAAVNAAGNTNFVAGPAAPQVRTIGDRLRISSANGATLRVQNYLYNTVTGQLLEGSASQGVDFQGPVNNQAPTNDAQLLEQDAQQGISR